MGCLGTWLSLVFLISAAAMNGQEAAPAQSKKLNRLLTGKLIYVGPMPDNLDQWIIEDLKVWGRYRRTMVAEGVDLVVEADVPERPTEWDMRRGVPRPRQDKHPRVQAPDVCSRQKPSEYPSATINIFDWVSNERLFCVHLINKKFKKEQDDAPISEHLDIFTKGLTQDQVAMKIVRKLREYVTELERTAGGKQ